MPLSPTACAICESPLREQIEKHDIEWKDIHTVQWARKQGLNISRFALLKHRTNHLQPVASGGNGNGTNASSAKPDQVVTLVPLDLKIAETPSLKVIRQPRKKREPKTITEQGNGTSLQILEAEEPAKPPVKSAEIPQEKSGEKATPAIYKALVTDQLLLDTVRDKVYEKLISGEIKLDLGDGFKAIEIKHKIAEESQNEKLLLEILNEIRSQELEG
ncbi:MAG TPA: hypothetical protein DEO84_03550 [candidate division Zixibacteria bacterium]|nr:hypothetical protein [candidate division Zixibacteria bacterium]HBZ00377.1 hypothetical protein [candidate division Zixibacteria bacterium]